MMKTIRNIGCLGIIVAIVFFLMAAFSGGDQFREWAEKAPEFMKKYILKAADKADDVKEDTERWKENVGRSTGVKKKIE
jgi:ABC-type taurine transport system substrate-binding protein